MYLDALKEHTRIDLVYDAVATLKKIEDDRPIRQEDIQLKYDAVNALARAEQEKILAGCGELCCGWAWIQ